MPLHSFNPDSDISVSYLIRIINKNDEVVLNKTVSETDNSLHGGTTSSIDGLYHEIKLLSINKKEPMNSSELDDKTSFPRPESIDSVGSILQVHNFVKDSKEQSSCLTAPFFRVKYSYD